MSKSTRTPLGAVRGLGSAHHGGEHWLKERFTSVAALMLGLWFVFSLALLPDLSRDTLLQWLKSPTAAVPMALFVLVNFIHARDGLKVVVDDYVHDRGTRAGVGIALDLLTWGAAAFALFAIAKISFGA